MLRKGYIQQQLEGLGQALGMLFGLELSQREVLQRLGTSCKNLTGLDLDTLLRLDDTTLLGLFSGGDRTRTAGNAFVAAQFLLQRAKADPTVARAARRKAFLLYSEALALEACLRTEDYRAELESLLAEVESTEASPPVLRQAARVHEALGALDRAENYHIYLQDAAAQGAKSDALAFYERLLTFPEDELAAGGLPREEILSALVELRLSPKTGR